MDFGDTGAAFLLFKEPEDGFPDVLDSGRLAVLSSSGDLKEAAANIFSALHKVDNCGAEKLYAEAVPEQGLGAAVMDRLARASMKYKREF
jgi:L-threonylcarbamoyladenylate synthase